MSEVISNIRDADIDLITQRIEEFSLRRGAATVVGAPATRVV